MSRALEIFRNAWSGTTKIAACGAPALFALTACHRPAHQRGLPPSSTAAVDVSQAEMMLQVLAAARSEQPPAEVLRKVMTAHGTELVIQQQNISRAVSPSQYRMILERLHNDVMPAIPAVAPGERARRGVDGLERDVWPSLKWGMTHLDLLRQRLDTLRSDGLYERACDRAAAVLPPRSPVTAHLFVVAGGRAGAAAFDNGDIYFDVLATSYRVALGTIESYPSTDGIVGFYAHEMHHLALGQIIDSLTGGLTLVGSEQQAFAFLRYFAMEGSATYLVSERTDLAAMAKEPLYREPFAHRQALAATAREVLQHLLDGGLDEESYERAIAPFTGNGWHVVGATMFDAIDRATGRASVIEAMQDPRALPLRYDEALLQLGVPVDSLPFAIPLARRVAAIGTSTLR